MTSAFLSLVVTGFVMALALVVGWRFFTGLVSDSR